MSTYTSAGFRPVKANDIREAAELFAVRAARRKYGRRGCVAAFRIGSYTKDMSLVEAEAFIGYRIGLNQTTGGNIHLAVRESKGNQ